MSGGYLSTREVFLTAPNQSSVTNAAQTRFRISRVMRVLTPAGEAGSTPFARLLSSHSASEENLWRLRFCAIRIPALRSAVLADAGKASDEG